MQAYKLCDVEDPRYNIPLAVIYLRFLISYFLIDFVRNSELHK
jgi:hypothetical protein